MPRSSRRAFLSASLFAPAALSQPPIQYRTYDAGRTAYCRGSFAESIRLLQQAVTDVPPLRQGAPLSALMETFAEIGNLQTARDYLKAARRAGLSGTVDEYRAISFCLADGQLKLASELCERAILTGISGAGRAILESVKAETLFALNKIPESEALMNKALSTLASDPKRRYYPWECGWALLRSARMAERQGQHQRALDQSAEAFKFAQPRWGDDSPLTLLALDHYGSALANTGEPAKGRVILDRVLRLRRDLYVESAPAVRGTKERLEALPKVPVDTSQHSSPNRN